MMIQKIVQFDIAHGEEAVVTDDGWVLFRDCAMRTQEPKGESDFLEPPDDPREYRALRRVFDLTYSHIHATRDKAELQDHLNSVHGQGFPVREPRSQRDPTTRPTGWYICPDGASYYLVSQSFPMVQENIGKIEDRFKGIIKYNEQKLAWLRSRIKVVKPIALNTGKREYIDELKGIKEEATNASGTLEWAKAELKELQKPYIPESMRATPEDLEELRELERGAEDSRTAEANYIRSINI